MKVYKNEYGWSTLCKGKNQDGSENKCYMSIKFWNCNEPDGEDATIEVNSFFMGASKTKNGVMPKMIVTMWSSNVEEPKVEQPKSVQTSAFERYDEEVLPF